MSWGEPYGPRPVPRHLKQPPARSFRIRGIGTALFEQARTATFRAILMLDARRRRTYVIPGSRCLWARGLASTDRTMEPQPSSCIGNWWVPSEPFGGVILS